VLSEAFPWQGWLGLMVSLAGVAVVAHPPFLFGGHAGWGVARVAGIGIDVMSACCGAGEGCVCSCCGIADMQLICTAAASFRMRLSH
jgi:drug/metabolite transporter (DMT)-like permease